jgi:predicted nucleic acid-binding protein
MRVVIDTSILVKWFFDEDGSKNALKLKDLLQNGDISILLPNLVKYEFGSVCLNKGIDEGGIDSIVRTFYALPLKFIAIGTNVSLLAYKIAKEHSISFYDASFLAISEIKKIPFITADLKLIDKVTGGNFNIISLESLAAT